MPEQLIKVGKRWKRVQEPPTVSPEPQPEPQTETKPKKAKAKKE